MQVDSGTSCNVLSANFCRKKLWLTKLMFTVLTALSEDTDKIPSSEESLLSAS